MHLRVLLLCAVVGLAAIPGGTALSQPPAPAAGLKVVGEYDSGSETVWSLAYSPDGKHLAVGTGQQLIIWNVAGHKIQARWTHPYSTVLWAGFTEIEKSTVAVASTQANVVLLNPTTGGQVGTLDLDLGKQALHGLTVGQEHRVVIAVIGGSRVALCETGALTAKWSVERDGERFLASAISPDGKTVAIALDGGAVRLYRTVDGKELRRIPRRSGRPPTLRGFSYTRRGDELLIADRGDSRIRVIDVTGDRPDHDLIWEHPSSPRPTARSPEVDYRRPEGIEALAHSPDGTIVALLCNDGTMRLYETLTWGLRHVAAVKGIRLTFTPDSRQIAVGVYGSGRVTVYDWRKPDGPTGTTKTADELWQLLGSPDAATAFRAVTELAATPATAVAVIGERLKPIRVLDDAQAARLVAGLAAKDYQAREAATTALGSLGVVAEPALRKAVTTTSSPEVRARAGRLLFALTRRINPERLRFARAVEILECCGTPAALAVLRELSSGAQSFPETEEARAALARAEATRPRQ